MFDHKPRITMLFRVLTLGCMICHGSMAARAADDSGNDSNTAKPKRLIPPVRISLRANKRVFNQGEFVVFSRTTTNVSMFDVEMPVFDSEHTIYYWTHLRTLKTRRHSAGLDKTQTNTLGPGETIVERHRINLVTHNLGPYFLYISSSFPDGSTVQSDVIKYEVSVDIAVFCFTRNWN